jgi:hypothetical protein
MMHPVIAHQVAKTVVRERVKQAEMVRMAREARTAKMLAHTGSEPQGEEPASRTGKFLTDASKWVRTRFTPASA